MAAGIDKFIPTSEEQELFNKVFYPEITEEFDIDVKEIEPQREGVFLCRLRLVLLINGCVVDEKSTANLLD